MTRQPPPDPLNNPKSELRTRIKSIVEALDEQARHEASVRACRRAADLEEFQHANVIMLYMPLPGEVDLTSLALRCFQSGKTVCVPRVDWIRRDMSPVEALSFDDRVMDVDEHGVRVPRDQRPIDPSLIDLAVVPGLAFDATGHRLGRGGGYYDRFLRRLHPKALLVGLAFDMQIVDEVPVNDRDVPVDVVATDRRTIRAKSARSRR